MIAVYAWSHWSSALPQYKHETLFVPTFFLYVLTFPISLIYQMIYTILSIIVDLPDLGTSFLNWMLYTWFFLVVFGYMQWFVLFPLLIRSVRNR